MAALAHVTTDTVSNLTTSDYGYLTFFTHSLAINFDASSTFTASMQGDAVSAATNDSPHESIAAISTMTVAAGGTVQLAGATATAISTLSVSMSVRRQGEPDTFVSTSGSTPAAFAKIVHLPQVEVVATSGAEAAIWTQSVGLFPTVAAVSGMSISGETMVFGPSVIAAALSTFTVKATLSGESLTVEDYINAIFSVWGIPNATMANEELKNHAVIELNAALQIVYSQQATNPYIGRTRRSYVYAIGVAEKTLESDVQGVVGPIRIQSNKRPLRPLSTQAQFHQFGQIFLDQIADGAASGEPFAYYIERHHIETGKDGAQIKLMIAPTPAVSTTLDVDVCLEAPRIQWGDYNTARSIYLPHRYSETVLLPIVRWKAANSKFSINREGIENYKAEYGTALEILGLIDPQKPEAKDAVTQTSTARAA